MVRTLDGRLDERLDGRPSHRDGQLRGVHPQPQLACCQLHSRTADLLLSTDVQSACMLPLVAQNRRLQLAALLECIVLTRQRGCSPAAEEPAGRRSSGFLDYSRANWVALRAQGAENPVLKVVVVVQ